MVNGHAVAGGFVHSMTFDFRIVNKKAMMSLSEINIGLGIPKGILAPIKHKLR